MEWFRLDSGFTRHPKILALTPAQRWIWLGSLCWVASFQEDTGILSPVADEVVVGLAEARARFREVGLLDDGDEVHDWLLYTGATVETKVDWYLAKHPEASANEVAKAVGGNRTAVLAEVKKRRPDSNDQFQSGTEGGSAEPLSEPAGGGSESGTQDKTRQDMSFVDGSSEPSTHSTDSPTLAVETGNEDGVYDEDPVLTGEVVESKPASAVARDALWDAMVDVCGDVSTGLERSRRGKVVKELLAAHATPDDVYERARNLRFHWPKITTITDTYLMGRWSVAASPPENHAGTTAIEEVFDAISSRSNVIEIGRGSL